MSLKPLGCAGCERRALRRRCLQRLSPFCPALTPRLLHFPDALWRARNGAPCCRKPAVTAAASARRHGSKLSATGSSHGRPCGLPRPSARPCRPCYYYSSASWLCAIRRTGAVGRTGHAAARAFEAVCPATGRRTGHPAPPSASTRHRRLADCDWRRYSSSAAGTVGCCHRQRARL